MKLKLKIVLPLGIVVGLAAFAAALGAVAPSSASAASKAATNQNSKPATEKAESSTSKDQNKTDGTSTAVYNYVAQPGDSFTKMARKAVQTFGIVKHINLSGAQIIYAETNMTQAAGSPVLGLEQKVSIKVSDIQSWVSKAQKLDKAQLAAWNYYVQFVDFNTNNVGEVRK